MKQFLLVGILVIIAGGIFWYLGAPSASSPAPVATEEAIMEALQSAEIDVSDFGGTTATLENGEAAFSIDLGNGETAQGFVSMSDQYAAIYKGDDADVYAVAYINGGGTGTFATLIWFEYHGADQFLEEHQKYPLGDRIGIESVFVQQTAPTSYDVLVSLKERLPNEGMAALPTQPRVLHFVNGSYGLEVRDVIFGTVDAPEVVLANPLPGAAVAVGADMVVAGAARGPWFFEASFPIEIRTLSGDVLHTAVAQAQGEWMTEGLVPFTATISGAVIKTPGAYVVEIKKDNPSGLPEHAASFPFIISVQ